MYQNVFQFIPTLILLDLQWHYVLKVHCFEFCSTCMETMPEIKFISINLLKPNEENDIHVYSDTMYNKLNYCNIFLLSFNNYWNCVHGLLEW